MFFVGSKNQENGGKWARGDERRMAVVEGDGRPVKAVNDGTEVVGSSGGMWRARHCDAHLRFIWELSCHGGEENSGNPWFV